MQQNRNISVAQLPGGPIPTHSNQSFRSRVPMQNVASNARAQPQPPTHSQQHAINIPPSLPPSYPHNQLFYPHSQHNPAARYDQAQGSGQIPPGQAHVSASTASVQSIPAVRIHHHSRSSVNSINPQAHFQAAPSSDLRQLAPRNANSATFIQPGPGHVVPNYASTYQDLQVGASRQVVQGSAQPLPASNRSSGFHPQIPGAPNGLGLAQHPPQAQNQLNVGSQQQQQQTFATFAARAATGTRESTHVPSEQAHSKTAAELAFEAADRHASNLLTRTYHSLNSLYEVQKNVLRNEFLRLNAMHQHTLKELKEERHRATRAAEELSEAKMKQDNAIRASEAVIAKALKWKESLEDTRRKYSVLQAQHTKVARIALDLNEQLKSDSRTALTSDLQSRVEYLEARLKQYEIVHPGRLETKIPSPLKDESDFDTSPSTTLQDFSSPLRDIDKSDEDSPDPDKQRLQRIVVDLLERNSEHTTTSDAQSTKGGASMDDAEAKAQNTSYIIDLTIDDEVQPPSLNQALKIPADSAPHHSSNSVQTTTSSEPEPGPAPSSDSAPFKNPLITPPGDGQKRDIECTNDESRARKRMRSSSSSSSRTLAEASEATETPAQTQSTEEGGDGWPTLFSCTNKLVGGFPSGTDAGKCDAPVNITSSTQVTSVSPADHHCSPPQLDAVHLGLIYHKNRSGASECRFCVMESDVNIRDASKKRIFSVAATNEELIDHALSDHRSIVSHMLKLDRSEILEAMTSIMLQ